MAGEASDQLLGVLGAASHPPVAGSIGVSKEVAGARETPVVLKHGDVPVRVLTVMELEEIGALRAAAKRRLLSFHVSKVFEVAEDIGFVRSVPTSVLWTSNSKSSRIRISRLVGENENDSSEEDEGPETVLHAVLQLGGSGAEASGGSSGAEGLLTQRVHDDPAGHGLPDGHPSVEPYGGGPVTPPELLPVTPPERLPVPFTPPRGSGHTPASVTPTLFEVTVGIYVHASSGASSPEVSVVPAAPAAATLGGCTLTEDMLSAGASTA